MNLYKKSIFLAFFGLFALVVIIGTVILIGIEWHQQKSYVQVLAPAAHHIDYSQVLALTWLTAKYFIAESFSFIFIAGAILFLLWRNHVAETQKRVLEGELRQSRFLLSFANGIEEGFFTFDRDFKVTFWNHGMQKITGVSPRQITGKNVLTSLPYLKDPKLAAPYRDILEGKSTIQKEVSIKYGDKVLLVNRNFFPTFDPEHKNVIGGIGLIYDVAPLKKMEEELQKTEKKLQVILENLPDIIWSLNPERQLLYISPNCRQMLGYSSAELVPHPNPWQALVVPDEFPETEKNLNQALAGETTQFECRMVTKEGKIKLFQVFCSPVLEGENVTGVDGIWHDITESSQLQQQLLQSQKMESLGQLAGGIAHDFNNILTAINGFAATALLSIGQPEKACSYLSQIPEQSQRASELISRLLLFSRHSVSKRKPLELVPFAQELSQVLRRTLPETIHIETSFSEETPVVDADLVQLQQVLMNLATNARDAMRDGGTLSISTSPILVDSSLLPRLAEVKNGLYALLCFRDTGTGIAPEIQKRIFEPFFTTKEPGKGTGLGMSIVYSIVKQHGGFIHLYSEVGKGTEFKIYLPASQSQKKAAAVEETDDGNLPGGNERLLLVEDDSKLCEITELLLRRWGYQVSVVRNGKEAIELMRKGGPEFHLVLSDVVMPKIGGVELFRLVKKDFPKTRILLMSGYSFEKEIQSLQKEGISGFISKPFRVSFLAKEVRKALDNTPGSGSKAA